MALPPLWKVRRELNRIRTKTRLFASRRLYDPIRKPIYDMTAGWRLRITKGDLPLTDRVAVFVVFQPKGVAASILMTLEHLRQNNFSPFVVSNGPLRPEDHAVLARNTALILERPNVGYDFGGYRDGIRHLWSLRQDLSRLVLMNDSTWFPLRRDDDSLARMEALDADLAGHIYKIEDENKRQNDHVESHLLMISKDFFKSEEFRSFWVTYKMSDHRARTIEVGEKGLTQMAIKNGRKIRTLMSREWLLSVLNGLDDAKLREVLDRTIDGFSSDEVNICRIRQIAKGGGDWRADYLNWVDASLRNSRLFLLSATFAMPALVYGRMGFAKKTRDIRFQLAREETLEIETLAMIPSLDEVVRSEIAEAIRSWSPAKDQERFPRLRRSNPCQ